MLYVLAYGSGFATLATLQQRDKIREKPWHTCSADLYEAASRHDVAQLMSTVNAG